MCRELSVWSEDAALFLLQKRLEDVNESVLCVFRGRDSTKSCCGAVRWPQHSFLPPISSDKKKERETSEPEAARGVELLCNYNMVLKSKYQTLATSAGRHREKGEGGIVKWMGYKKIGKGS